MACRKIKKLESGSSILIAHATVGTLPEPGGGDVAITLDKTFAELTTAEYSVIDLGMEFEGTRFSYFLPLTFKQGLATVGYTASSEGGVFNIIGTPEGFSLNVEQADSGG